MFDLRYDLTIRTRTDVDPEAARELLRELQKVIQRTVPNLSASTFTRNRTTTSEAPPPMPGLECLWHEGAEVATLKSASAIVQWGKRGWILRDSFIEECSKLREAMDHALRNLSPTFESDPPSVKQASKILRRALGR